MAEEKIEITRADWARVWAKAILEGRAAKQAAKQGRTLPTPFKDLLERDPLQAAQVFRNTVDKTFPNPEKLIDDMKEYEEDSGKHFSEKQIPELTAIITNGGEPVQYNELKKKP